MNLNAPDRNLQRYSLRCYNPSVAEVIDHYPRRGSRRGRKWSQYCNTLSLRVRRRLRYELRKCDAPDLGSRWRIRALLNHYFRFYKRHYAAGYRIRLDPPTWLVDELRWNGSWRPKQRGGSPR